MEKLTKSFPKAAGVYLFKDAHNSVIYIGKAKNLHNRVSSYFRRQNTDWKAHALVAECADVDFVTTKNETEALLLEAQLIKEHQPKFNVLLKSGQPFVYLLFTAATLPTLQVVRNKKEKGTYFGPFLHKIATRKVHQFLMNTFRLNVCNKKIPNGCLDFHLGRCAGSCQEQFDTADYLVRLELAKQALKKDHKNFTATIKQQIVQYNSALAFEKSKQLVDYLENMELIFETINTKFSEDKYDARIFELLVPRQPEDDYFEVTGPAIQQLLQLHEIPLKIDCFDISHFQSSYLVGSCVRFTAGQPDKNSFRRFKIKSLQQQNDYAALQEIVARRYKTEEDLPDLIVIDGGKGQLSAALMVAPDVPCVSLAKREERLFCAAYPEGVVLDVQTPAGKLFIALRDYAHHFAITYHRSIRSAK